jgi:dipeptidyl aminopeptidase/acylaminoacyl peptidase
MIHVVSGRGVYLAILLLAISSTVDNLHGQELTFDPSPLRMPQIPTQVRRAPLPSDLIEIRDLHGLQISPDGQRIAFIVSQSDLQSNTYRTALFVIQTNGTNLTNLGTAGPAHLDSIHQWLPDPPQWSADSKSVYYRYKPEGGIWGIWRWSIDGNMPAQITHVGNPVSSFSLTPGRSALWLTLDVPDDSSKRQELGILYDGTLTAWQGISITEERLRSEHHDEHWRHDLRDGSERKATAEELKTGVVDDQPHLALNGEVLRQKISPDGKYLAYQTYVDDPIHSKFSRYPIFIRSTRDDSKGIEVSPSDYRTLGQYWWAHKGRVLYYVERNNGELPRLMMVENDGKSRGQVLASEDFMDQFSFDDAGQYAALSRQNSVVPPQVAIASLATKAVAVLLDLNPELKSLEFSPARRIEFSTKSGEHFHGHLVLPFAYEPGKRYPLIITGYSDVGEFLRGGTGDEYPIQLFARQGFVVLNFSVSHNGLSIAPGDFDRAILRLQAPLDGMRAAISYLDSQGIIDRSKVGITGLSHGAEVLCYAISHSDLFKAAIASGPPGDEPYFFYMAGKTWQEVFSSWGLTGWPEGPASERWHKISATLNSDHIHTPLLINAADSEYLVSLALVTSLEQLHKPVEMFVYPNESHIKNQPLHRREIYERNVDWFNFWLKDQEDSAGPKTDQYGRWEKLRTSDAKTH